MGQMKKELSDKLRYTISINFGRAENRHTQNLLRF